MGSAVGLVAGTLGRLYASAFYALQDARTPLAFASLRVVLSAVLAYVSVRYGPGWFGVPVEIGAVGITATTGFAAWLEYLLLRRALARRIGRTGIPGRRLLWFWGSALHRRSLALLGKAWMTVAGRAAPVGDALLGVAGAARAGAEPGPRRRRCSSRSSAVCTWVSPRSEGRPSCGMSSPGCGADGAVRSRCNLPASPFAPGERMCKDPRPSRGGVGPRSVEQRGASR